MAVDAGAVGHPVTDDDGVSHPAADVGLEATADDESCDAAGESVAEGVELLDAATEDGAIDGVRSSWSTLRLPALVITLVICALTGLVCYLGVRDHQSQGVKDERNLLLQVARQGAVNLTTIDWQHADADVQRILGSATGEFYDDFAQRSKPFVDVVEQVKSTSVGTVTEAGIESFSGDAAQVLLSVSVKTTNPGAPEQSPRNWRMRMTVQRVDDGGKVANVEFVP